MSKRHRHPKNVGAKAAAAVAETTLLDPAASLGAGLGGGWGTNGHAAADWSRLRGQIYFPQLDTRREITPLTRIEIMRKARWFCANHGLPRRIVFGLSRLAAGTGLTPHPLTSDRQWNKEALAYVSSRFESPVTYDVGGRFDFYSAQPFALACHYRDGDQPTILTESATAQAMFALYEGHQVHNGGFGVDAAYDNPNWFDGVRADRNNRATAYRFVDSDGKATDVDAAYVMLLAEYERAGQHRSASILEHACNHLHDGTEIVSFIKTGVKLTNQYGYWIEKQPNTATGPTPTSSGPKRVVDIGGGNSVTLEQIIGGGAIPELAPGTQLKFNNAAHPHPNQLTLLDYLIRDVAWGVGVSPDLLWNIAALGGANTRFVLADAQSWVEKEQEKLIRLKLQREYVYTIAKGIAAGKLRKSPDPEWWKVGWIPPPRLTVDYGRDGKLYIEQNRSAMLTLKTVYGWQGQDWEPQIDQWLDEIEYIKKGMKARGIGWDDVQQYRSSTGNRPAEDGTASAYGDGLPNDPAQASAALAEIAKSPEKSAALLNHMRATPIAA